MKVEDLRFIQPTSRLVGGIAQPLTPSESSMLGRVVGAIALYLLRPRLALLGLTIPEYVLHSLNELPAWRLAQSRAEGIRRVRVVQSREPSPFIGPERSKIDFRLTYRTAKRRTQIDRAKYQEWLSLRNTVEGSLRYFVAPGKCFHGMLKGFCSACITPVLPPKVKSKRQTRINPGLWGWKPGDVLRAVPVIRLGDTSEPSVWPDRWYVSPRWVEGETPIEPTALRGEYREYTNAAHPSWHIEKVQAFVFKQHGPDLDKLSAPELQGHLKTLFESKILASPCEAVCSSCNNGAAGKLVARSTGRIALKQQIVSPARCVHGIISKPGESKSGICEPCRRGYPAWEHKPFKLDEISRVETISYSPIGRDCSIGFDGKYSGPSNSGTHEKKALNWDAHWRGEKPTVFFERGRTLEGVPFGPLVYAAREAVLLIPCKVQGEPHQTLPHSRVVIKGLAESSHPKSMLTWSDPYWWSGETREAFDAYLLKESCKPILSGLVTTTEAREKQRAQCHRTEPALLFTPHRNWCPSCLEYVLLLHDSSSGIACKEYQEQRELEAEYQAAKQAETLAALFEHHAERREARYAKQRELQTLAESLGDEWCATHPEMAAQLTFPDDCEAVEHGKAARDLIGGTRVNLRSWNEDRSENDFDSNTYEFGMPDTQDKDRSARDFRGDQRRRGTTIVSKTYKICLECSADLTGKRSDAQRCDYCRKLVSKLSIRWVNKMLKPISSLRLALGELWVNSIQLEGD